MAFRRVFECKRFATICSADAVFCLTAEIDLGAKGEEIKNESFAKGSPTRATTTTAASGGNREELLGQRPAGRECKTLHEADAGSRNPDAVAAKPATERFDNRHGSFFYFLSRLSLLVAQKVPTVWKICTSSTSRMTQTIIMLVW